MGTIVRAASGHLVLLRAISDCLLCNHGEMHPYMILYMQEESRICVPLENRAVYFEVPYQTNYGNE